MSSPLSDLSCFTDFALQEFVCGRLDTGVRAEVELHVRSCDACAQAIKVLRLESEIIRAALRDAPSSKDESAGTDAERFGRYMDGSLGDAEARELESYLVSNPAARAELIRIEEEVAATLAESGDGVRTAPPAVPAGEILRMPKRTAPPVAIIADLRRFGGGQAG